MNKVASFFTSDVVVFAIFGGGLILSGVIVGKTLKTYKKRINKLNNDLMVDALKLAEIKEEIASIKGDA